MMRTVSVTAINGVPRSMQVYATNALPPSSGAPTARRSAAGGSFTVASPTPQAPTAAGGVRPTAGIDALLVLQAIEDSTDRRKRAVKRARSALDTLDELKLGLLSGDPDPAALRRLQMLADIDAATGDARLDGILAEVALRVGVELAKAGIR
jgi:hypothetical protein